MVSVSVSYSWAEQSWYSLILRVKIRTCFWFGRYCLLNMKSLASFYYLTAKRQTKRARRSAFGNGRHPHFCHQARAPNSPGLNLSHYKKKSVEFQQRVYQTKVRDASEVKQRAIECLAGLVTKLYSSIDQRYKSFSVCSIFVLKLKLCYFEHFMWLKNIHIRFCYFCDQLKQTGVMLHTSEFCYFWHFVFHKL